MNLSKTLVISGGSSGIGKATADLFAKRGYRVFELSRTGQDRNGVEHVTCDVTLEADCKRALDEIMKQTDSLDVVICNAGWTISGPIEFATREDVDSLMNVNFYGALYLTQAVLPYMRAQRHGHLLFTSSVGAPLPIPYQAFYSVTKAALNAMALALRNEVHEFGIKVACLLPGDVQTNITVKRKRNNTGLDIYTNADSAIDHMANDERNGMEPEQMARIFWRMANSRHPKAFYIGGGLYKFLCFLQKILPTSLTNYIEGRLYS